MSATTTSQELTKDVWNSKRDILRKDSYESESSMSTDDWPSLTETIEKVTKLVLVDVKSSSGEGDDVDKTELSNDDPPQLLKEEKSSDRVEAWSDIVVTEGEFEEVGKLESPAEIPPVMSERRKSSKASKLKWIPLPLPDLPPLKQRNGRKSSIMRGATNDKSKPENYTNGTEVNGTDQSKSGRSSKPEHRRKLSPKATARAASAKHVKGRRTTMGGPLVSSGSSSINGDFPDFGIIGGPPSRHPGLGDFFMPYFVPSTAYRQPQPLDDMALVLLLRNQIEYYFGEENLSRDFYLRRKMDSEGYLPIHLIASFQRVQRLTTDFDKVVAAITSSTVLEVKDGCLRTIFNPLRWPIMDNVPLSPVALMPHSTRSFSLPMPCAMGL